MRIWFWKDGGSQNESNQVVILAINLRLRNRCLGGWGGPVKVAPRGAKRFSAKDVVHLYSVFCVQSGFAKGQLSPRLTQVSAPATIRGRCDCTLAVPCWGWCWRVS